MNLSTVYTTPLLELWYLVLEKKLYHVDMSNVFTIDLPANAQITYY